MKACLPTNQCTVPENTKLLQEDETTSDMHFNYDGIDCITESIVHNSLLTTEEKKMDNRATIGMQVDSINFLPESLIHPNSFIIEEEKNDMAATNNIINNNNYESIIVDMSTGGDKQAQTTHNKKRKCNKNKNLKAIGSNKLK